MAQAHQKDLLSKSNNESHELFIKRLAGSEVGSYTDGQEVYVQDTANMFSIDCSQDSDGGVVVKDDSID